MSVSHLVPATVAIDSLIALRVGVLYECITEARDFNPASFTMGDRWE